MDSMSELLKEISSITFEPVLSEDVIHVLVTHINHPESFYVRPLIYDDYLDELETPGDLISEDKLAVGKIVVYYSTELDRLVRGRIEYMEKVDDTTKCTMMCIDYGFQEPLVKTDQLYEAIVYVPPLATHCKLSCKPIGKAWTPAVTRMMEKVVGSGRGKMTVIEKTAEQLTVQLECLDDVTTFLILTDNAFFPCENNAVSRNTAPKPEERFIKHKQFTEGETLTVQVQSGKFLDGFYVATLNDLKIFENRKYGFDKFCQKQARPLTVDDIRPGELVCVSLDKSYEFERGVIVNVLSPTRARTQLLDWGNFVETNVCAIKSLDAKFMHAPIAIYCAVEEKQSTDMRLQKFISKGRELIITIIKTGDGFTTPYIVHLEPKPRE